jgi:hypothetical protein
MFTRRDSRDDVVSRSWTVKTDRGTYKEYGTKTDMERKRSNYLQNRQHDRSALYEFS